SAREIGFIHTRLHLLARHHSGTTCHMAGSRKIGRRCSRNGGDGRHYRLLRHFYCCAQFVSSPSPKSPLHERNLLRRSWLMPTKPSNKALQPTALWRCASMSISISVPSTVAQLAPRAVAELLLVRPVSNSMLRTALNRLCIST